MTVKYTKIKQIRTANTGEKKAVLETPSPLVSRLSSTYNNQPVWHCVWTDQRDRVMNPH